MMISLFQCRTLLIFLWWISVIVPSFEAFVPQKSQSKGLFPLQRRWVVQVAETKESSNLETSTSQSNPRQNNHNIGKKVVSNKSRERQQFRTYLRNMWRKIKNKRTLANRMDDELKQMEIDFYGIDPNEDELLQLRYPESVSYRGKVVEPDLSCYAMTASAYAKSNLGRAGAELAEQVLRRCEKYCSSQQPNAILKTAIVKAWLQAGDFDRADEWIKDMEKTFAESRDEIDAPDTITYTQYLEGLANARNLPVEEIVRRCRRLLEKMQHLAGSGENPFARPNTFTYSAAMKCLARRQANLKKGELVVMEEVEELLRELQAKYNESGDEELKPNNYCYVAVANVGSRCYGGMQAARRTERLLRELEKQYKATGDPDFYPLDGMYTACFTAYAKVEPEHVSEASERVKDLLHELENGDRKYPPTVHAYTAAINGLTMDDNPGNLKEAEAILKRLPGPDSIAYQCVIKAYARNDNVVKADELLWELHNLATAQNTERQSNQTGLLPPDIVTIASVINAWSRAYSGRKHEALESSRLLLEMIVDAYREGKILQNQKTINTWVFENVIRLWSISKHSDAGEESEKLIDVMNELAVSTADHLKPNIHVYVLTLDAWATSNRKDAPKRAKMLLERIESLAEEGELEQVNVRALSSALTSTAKSKHSNFVEYSEKLFKRIVELYKAGDRSAPVDARTVTSVLSAFANSGDRDAADRSIFLIRQMRQLAESGFENFELNTIAYNILLNLFAKRGLPNQAEHTIKEMQELSAQGYACEPDTVSWSCVCRAYANSNHPNGTTRVEEILAAVEEGYNNGNMMTKPDSMLYNAVLTTLARAANDDPSAAARTDEILTRMELSSISENPVVPDLVSFSSACQAHALCGTKEGALRAESLLQQAEASLIPFPDAIFYSALALAFTKSKLPGSLRKAEELVQRMEELHASGRKNIMPSTQTRNFLLSGLAYSKDRDKLEKSQTLLEKMKETKAGPDIYSYNWVILAAARTQNKSPEDAKKAFQSALKYFREIHDENTSGVKPNSFTYGYFLKACSTLLPSGGERDKLMAKAFDLCRRRGLVSKEVLADSAKLMPEILNATLVAEGIQGCLDQNLSTNFSLLPLDWTRNLPTKVQVSSKPLLASK